MSKRINWSIDGTNQYYSVDLGVTIAGLVSTTDQAILDSDPIANNGTVTVPQSGWRGYYWNFPSEMTISKFACASSVNRNDYNITMEVSSDSTNGLDGTWTPVRAAAPISNSSVPIEYVFTPVSCKWFRCTGFQQQLGNGTMYRLLIFGDYDNPNFEFWNGAGTAELDGDWPIVMSTAPNNTDYHDWQSFTIKNTDLVNPHTYIVSIVASKYGGDALVDSYWTLSDDPVGDQSWNKTATLTITDLAADTVSDELRVYVDVPEGNNPADGHHYYIIRVEEQV